MDTPFRRGCQWISISTKKPSPRCGATPAGAGFFTLSIFVSLTGPEPDGSLANTRFGWVIPLAVFLWCLVIGYGAYEMDKLGNYRMAKIASVLALIPVPVPLYLLWFIGGLLGLSALSTPAVRAAFAAGNEGAREAYLATRRRPGPPPLPHERGDAGEEWRPNDYNPGS